MGLAAVKLEALTGVKWSCAQHLGSMSAWDEGEGRTSNSIACLLSGPVPASNLATLSACLSCRKYDARSFRNDLKEVLRVAGVEGRPTLLLLEDHQLEDPGVLEAVNSLLAGGEVPGLFTPEELAKDLAPLDRAADEDMTYNGPRQLYPYFLHRLQQKLRVCVCLNPEGPQYKARCEANPALLTRCTMVWWSGWSEDSCSLLAAAELQVRRVVRQGAPPLAPGKGEAGGVGQAPGFLCCAAVSCLCLQQWHVGRKQEGQGSP